MNDPILYSFLSLIVLYSVFSIFSLFWIKRNKLKKADIIIVLEGSTKYATINRLKKTKQLYDGNYAKKVLVSGKRLVPWMIQKLTTLGIPYNKIVVQNKSTNTLEDAEYSYKKLKDLRRVILVTASIHQRRASKTFKNVFKNTEIINAPSSDLFHVYSFYFPTGWISTLSEIIKYFKYVH